MSVNEEGINIRRNKRRRTGGSHKTAPHVYLLIQEYDFLSAGSHGETNLECDGVTRYDRTAPHDPDRRDAPAREESTYEMRISVRNGKENPSEHLDIKY